LPQNFGFIDRGVVYNVITSSVANDSAAASQNNVAPRLIIPLAAGQTITLYSQAWVIFSQDNTIPHPFVSIHASMAVDVQVFKGGVIV